MIKSYNRAITPVESIFSLSPFSVVAMVFKIKGDLRKEDLEKSIGFIRNRHPFLNTVIHMDFSGKKTFAPAPTNEIHMEVVDRKSEDHWKELYHSQCAIPFDFEKKPCIRFTLIRSKELSELMIFSHHIICDGLSLAFLGRDLLEFMGNPVDREIEPIETIPAGIGNMPRDLKVSGFIESILEKMNDKFNLDREYFNISDYRDIHKAYWQNYSHEMISLTLSEDETSSIVKACKVKGVSVNSALSAAICGARKRVMGNDGVPNKHSSAVSIRDRLPSNPDEGMGFFAGSIDGSFIYKYKKEFWENAMRYHKSIRKRMRNKEIFKNILKWSRLDPGIMESLNFKILGSLADQGSKARSYSGKKDLVSSLVRRVKMDSLDNMIMATAVTNLGNLKFERKYGDLELDSLIMNPGGAFPLAMVQLVVAASTVSGKLSLLFEYEKSRLTEKQARFIMELTLKYLRS